jgi:Bacterial regulatory proteins, tetR family.
LICLRVHIRCLLSGFIGESVLFLLGAKLYREPDPSASQTGARYSIAPTVAIDGENRLRMPKRSKAQTQQTIELILAEAKHQLLMLGYEGMSYTTLSEATGVSRTGISHHFPRKQDFMVALEPFIVDSLRTPLDTTSTINAFMTSWMQAMHANGDFKATLKLCFYLLISGKADNGAAFRILKALQKECELRMQTDLTVAFSQLLGASLLLCRQKSEGHVK